jgi:hypothetical protein
MEVWGCSRWNGTTTMIQGALLSSLAVAGLIVGLLVISAPLRPRSVFAKLAPLQSTWMGAFVLVASLGMLSLVVPPMLGFNRCP